MSIRLAMRIVLPCSVIALFAFSAVIRVADDKYVYAITQMFLWTICVFMVSLAYVMATIKPRMGTDEWFVKSARYYMRYGFFDNCRAMTNRRLLAELKLLMSEVHGKSLPEDHTEIWLLTLDEQRVVWGDLEADVCSGNDVYVDLIKSMSRISRGAFQPTDVLETWDSESGPIRVEFMHHGVQHCLEPEYFDDWIDPRIIVQVNPLISDSQLYFMGQTFNEQNFFLLALTLNEARLLRRERGLPL